MTSKWFLGAALVLVLGACSSESETAAPSDSTITKTEVIPNTNKAELPRNAEGKFIVSTRSDMPDPYFKTEATAKELIFEDHPDYAKLVDFVETELKTIETDYAISDEKTLGVLRDYRKTLANARQDWDKTLRLSQDIKADESDPAARAMMFLNNDSYIKAMRDTGEASGSAFEAAYRANLEAALDELDLELVGKKLRIFYRSSRLNSLEKLKRDATISLNDAGAFDDLFSMGEARAVLDFRYGAGRVAHNAILLDALETRLADIPKVEIVDRWSERLIDVKEGTPVTVAVWDSGVDPDVMGARMWTRPEGETRGNKHGLAYGSLYKPEAGELAKIPPGFAKIQGEQMKLIKGSLDTQAGIDSPEADAFFDYQANLKAEDAARDTLRLGFFGTYIHGQHVADITASGNDLIEIMNIRMMGIAPVYETAVKDFVSAIQDSVDYLKDHDVRVVNMSWRISYPMIEGALVQGAFNSQIPKMRERARKLFAELEDGMEKAFASAPDIFFIAAAGNEDENVDFVQSVPSGINLPNLITVGAVDSGLKAASFTSFGESIDVYANGYEVPARVPGGEVLALSGTSMAAPQVANLAAKILTQNPDMSVSEVRDLILSTATQEGELRVIHPKAAMGALD